MNEERLKAWLGLSLLYPGSGVAIHELLQHHQSDPCATLANGNSQKSLTNEQNSLIEAALAWRGPQRELLTPDSEYYPDALRRLPDAPLLLYVMGEISLLTEPQLAIVGSRTPTPGGSDNARGFAAELSRAGLLITSGLALGIDAAAHEGCLAASGKTIAVIGTGIDRVYPARHRDLAHKISLQGAIVSEFPMGTPPLKGNFPRRNRLIAGLSLGTLVVEAALSSGSLITAREALEAGREVFAIPGSIHNPLSRGCHALIRQGAKLVETAQDVLEDLGWLASALHAEQLQMTEFSTDPEHDALLEAMGFDPVNADVLVERTGYPPENVAGMLLTLELNSRIDAVPGGYLRRK